MGHSIRSLADNNDSDGDSDLQHGVSEGEQRLTVQQFPLRENLPVWRQAHYENMRCSKEL